MTDYQEGPSDELTLVEEAVKKTSTTKSDSLTLAEDLAKKTSASKSDAITIAEVLSKEAKKVLTDSVSLAESKTHSIGKSLIDEIGIVRQEDIATDKVLSDAVTLAEELTKSITKSEFSEAITLAEDLVKKTSLVLSDSLTVAATASRDSYEIYTYETSWYNNPKLAADSLQSKINTIDTTYSLHYVEIVDRAFGKQFKGVLLYGTSTS